MSKHCFTWLVRGRKAHVEAARSVGKGNLTNGLSLCERRLDGRSFAMQSTKLERPKKPRKWRAFGGKVLGTKLIRKYISFVLQIFSHPFPFPIYRRSFDARLRIPSKTIGFKCWRSFLFLAYIINGMIVVNVMRTAMSRRLIS